MIVARSYVRQIAMGSTLNPAYSHPDDYSPRDRVGHGTAVASAAAGEPDSGGTVPIVGMAPKAYLGNYKVYGSPGVNDYPSEDVWIQAINDAFNDGMDVVNFSSGFPALAGAEETGSVCGTPAGVPCDPLAYAFEAAARNGMVIVVAAGNGQNYYDPYSAQLFFPTYNSIGSPAIAPSVITVGATMNSHVFLPAVSMAGPGAPAGVTNLKAFASDSWLPYSPGAVTAPLVDVSTIGDGYGCSAFPAGSLTNAFALIQRGPTGAGGCGFSTKASNAWDAGAAGVIIYNAPDSPALYGPNQDLIEQVDFFLGPVVGLVNADGVALKAYLAANRGAQAVINLSGREQSASNTNQLAGYSSLGPTLAALPGCTGCTPALLKPELVATGGGDSYLSPDMNDVYMMGYPGMYLAAENYDPLGILYSSNRYTGSDGTSFASPLVAGAAALVKQAHPTWTAAQIKSALVNGANGTVVTTSDFADPVDVRWTGAGLLDAGVAVRASVAAVPSTVSFGAVAAAGPLPSAKSISVTNLGSSAVSLTVAVAAEAGRQATGTTVAVDKQTLSLGAAGSSTATATLNVSLNGSVPAAGSYSGNVSLTGSGVALRVPYLFLVGGATAASTVYGVFGSTFSGLVSQDVGAVPMQLLDANGVPVPNAPVTFSVPRNAITLGSVTGSPSCSPASSTVSVTCNTDNYGMAWVDLQLGSAPGSATVTVSGAGLTSSFDVTTRAVPTIAGVSDSAKGKTPIAPGSYVSIYGTNLADFTDVVTTPTLPLNLGAETDACHCIGVTVSFDVPPNVSYPGRLVYMGATQVNAQVPWELQGLPAGTSVQMKVTVDQTLDGSVFSVPLADVAPSFFETATNNVAARVAGTATIIGAGRPAQKGEYIELYANGLGPVDNQPASGAPATASPLPKTKNAVTITIGGQPVTPLYAGLSPGLPGLYQVNVQIPASLASGSQPIELTIAGQKATTAIPIQ